ncbi:MAG: D-glycero-alpha-D-manno-heptose-1,7-bisphosphate 7-phosphatase [Desulfovibrio sp.]
MNKVVFLDRDGTIIADKHYLSDPAGVELLPNAALGLQSMKEQGFSLVIVSNQSGIGRGYFSNHDLMACMDRLEELLKPYDVTFDAVLYCPHAPEEECTCRKPLTGMVTESSVSFDPARSAVVGDKACDVNLGKALNCDGILVRTGKGAAEEAKNSCSPHFIGDDLLAVADYLRNNKK